MDVVASLGNDMKKPVPVKIVEVLGWVYVALSFLAVISVIVLVFKKPSEWPSIIFAFTPVSLTVGMVMSLRRGRRAWFLWPNALLTSFVMMVAVFSVSKLALLWGVLSLILLVAPIVLLHIKSAKRWFNEMSGDERPIRFGVSIFFVAVFAIVILPVKCLFKCLFVRNIISGDHKREKYRMIHAERACSCAVDRRKRSQPSFVNIGKVGNPVCKIAFLPDISQCYVSGIKAGANTYCPCPHTSVNIHCSSPE